MITVANRTETAARVKYTFDHKKKRIDELHAPERTIHIDSKVLDDYDVDDKPGDAREDSPNEEDGEEGSEKRKLSKEEDRRDLFGESWIPWVESENPVRKVQNVISVGMLSEGWDARTVTHIMGLRAFSSQLLCEQVVGRGLRRMTYELKQGSELLEPGTSTSWCALHIPSARGPRRTPTSTTFPQD